MTDHEACATKVTGNVTKKRVAHGASAARAHAASARQQHTRRDYSPKIFSQPPCFVCTGAFLNLSRIIPTFKKNLVLLFSQQSGAIVKIILDLI